MQEVIVSSPIVAEQHIFFILNIKPQEEMAPTLESIQT